MLFEPQVTYTADWTNWIGAEEICRNQGYGLAGTDALASDSETVLAHGSHSAPPPSAPSAHGPLTLAWHWVHRRCSL